MAAMMAIVMVVMVKVMMEDAAIDCRVKWC